MCVNTSFEKGFYKAMTVLFQIYFELYIFIICNYVVTISQVLIVLN